MMNHFVFDRISKYFELKDHSESRQVISDQVMKDLDLEELFMRIDKTHTPLGQQYLYNRLRSIPHNSHTFSIQEKLISHIDSSADEPSIRKILQEVSSDDAGYLYSLFLEKQLKKPSWFLVIRLLSLASFASLILTFFEPLFFLLFLSILLINLGIHYWNKRNVYQYLLSLPQLIRLNRVAKKLMKQDYLTELCPTIKQATNTIDSLGFQMSIFKINARLEGDLSSIPWMFMELIHIVFLLEPLFLFNVLESLEKGKAEVKAVYEFVGEVDHIFGLIELRREITEHCLPAFTEHVIAAEHLYHPLILECVPNTITIDQKSILLTGSNMSGKTTFIRTLGINILLGQTLNTCFAKSMSLPRMSIYSAIRITDDLLDEKSYYFEEVQTIKQMVNESNSEEFSLFLLDELFKGTNTVERISAGKAVLSELARNHRVVVSTHDTELTELLQSEYDLYHFSEVIVDDKVTFDYQLKEGKLTTRNAIKILEINGYPESIVKEARRVSKKLDPS